MSTPNLNILHIQAAQNQKEVTANAAFDALDNAMNAEVAITMTDANYTLTSTSFDSGCVFVFTGTLTASRSVFVPDTNRSFIVNNSTTGGFSLIVTTASGTGITLANAATTYVALYCDGTNVQEVGSTGSSGVASLNSLTGALSVTSTGGTLTVTTSGSDVNVEVAGGGGGGMANPMTTVGDIIVGGSAGAAGRLGIGTSGQVLEVVSGAPAWTTPAGGGGGGVAFQTTQRRTTILPNASTTTLTVVGDNWTEDDIGSKSVLMATATHSAVLLYPPASSQNQLDMYTGQATSGGNYVTGRNIKLQFRGYWTTTGDGLLWIGMFNTPSTGNVQVGMGRAPDPSGTSQVAGAGFRCANKSGSSLETTWHAYVGTGSGAGTTVDTLVTHDTNEHTWTIIFNDTTPNITFYIDGTLVATVSSGLPATGKALFFFLGDYYTTTPINLGFASAIIDSDL